MWFHFKALRYQKITKVYRYQPGQSITITGDSGCAHDRRRSYKVADISARQEDSVKRGFGAYTMVFLGFCLESALVAQAIAPRTFRAIAGETRTAALHDGVPLMTAVTSTRTTPALEFPIRVLTTVAPESPGLKLVIPPATPPGEYTVEVTGRDSGGRPLSVTLQVTVDAVTVEPAVVATRPPAILLNGFQVICTDYASTVAASADTFDQLATLLQDDGASVLYFNNCAYGDISIEQLGAQLGVYIAGLRYTDGTPVPQVDLVAHSMGGLIARAYLAGKSQISGVFSPPINPMVRKLVTIGTPHFGSFQAGYIGVQESEMALGNQFLWDLATWNQGQDDLRGVDALAIIGNAGTYGNASNASDGVVSLTSGSLGFIEPDQRTRIVPYCHVQPSLLTNLGIGMSCSNPEGIAYIDSPSHLSAQIVRSFLANTTAWETVGGPPSQDPYLSVNGGLLLAARNASDQYYTDLNSVTATNANLNLTPGPSNSVASLFFNEWVPANTYDFAMNGTNETLTGTLTTGAGGGMASYFKPGPLISSVQSSAISGLPGRIVQSGGMIEISGSGFGQSQCSTCAVWAGPASLQVLSWSDQTITVILPSSSGFVRLVVETASGSDEINIMATGLSLAGSMAQIASAGGWDTSLTLVNLGTSAGDAQLNFFANDGSTPLLPFTFPQQPSQGTILGSTFDQTLNPNATLILDTTGASQTAATGSSQLLTSGNIGAFAIFTYTPSGQAAVVPLETRNASSYLLPFDDTGQISTGLAIANVAASAADVNVILRDDTGAQIGTGSITLPAQGHTSLMLTDTINGFPVTAGKRGTVEFDTPQGGQISVLGLRANAIPNSTNFAVTSLPVLASVGTGGGTMAHIASGGGWQTTFTLVNTGTSSATASLNFYGDNGSAVSLPLSFPQTGATSTATNVSQSIAAGASLIVVVQDSGGTTSTTGSAVLTTSGNIGGFAIFRYNTTGQEAVVPLETVNAPSYILAFDDTGSLSTGLAIANVAAQAASVNVIIRDDTGAQIGTGSISLPAHGHTKFMLTDTSSGGWAFTAGKRGTVEFDTPASGQIAPLGLRAASIPGGFTVTTIPVMEK
jgi:pimeloyl-ACP methyl ester carboxylesterase